ncbi:nuclease-related domain-containing protein [Streptomyces yangpuensis]|uniref:nuclease-related domain-containing protein n=1 Tax=Streptomyces yangpuensis TaxID=1648182 RepID=UPI003655A042
MSAGNSAQERAEKILRGGKATGVLARLRALVGLQTEPSAAAVAEAARWSAGAEGERRTAELVGRLAEEGWFGLFDRHIPGLQSANADIVLIGPDGQVAAIDAKLWHGRARVEAADGRLFHGEKDCSGVIRNVRFETDHIQRGLREALRRRGAARVPAVVPLIAMHNAPVADGGFSLDGVRIVPADRLLAVLRQMIGRPDPEWAALVAAAAGQLLTRYDEGGRR